MSTKTGITHHGDRLVREWFGTLQRRARAQQELARAEADFRNAERELSNWLLPPDAREGETSGVWFGDSLIQATALEPFDGKWFGPVKLRLQGPKWLEFVGQ